MKAENWLLAALLVATQCSAYQQIPDITIADNHSITQFSYAADSVSPVITISHQQILRSGAQTVASVLAYAGLQQRDVLGDGSNLQISMRGFGSTATQNTLILLNGHPIVYSDLGSFNFNQVPVSQIQAIKVYTSSMGVLYGNQAVGGVINIITRKTNTNQQAVSLGVGSNNTYQAAAHLYRILSSGLTYHVNVDGLTSKQYRQHNDTEHQSVNLGINQRFKNSQLVVDYQFYHQNLLYPGALTASEVQHNRRQSQTSTDYFNNSIHNLQADYSLQFYPAWQLSVKSLFHAMKGHGILFNAYTNQRDAVSLNPVLSGLFTLGKLTVISKTGLMFNHGQYQFDTQSYHTKASQQIYAGYSQLNLPFNKNWHFVTGLRYANAVSQQDIRSSNNDVSNDAIVSDVGLLWHPLSSIDVYLRRAGNYRFPKTDENSNTATGKPLETQTGVSYETGLSWHSLKWKALANIYHLVLDNEISAVPIPNSVTSFALNQNLPQTERNGYSVNLSYQWLKPLSLQLIYHYVHAVFTAGPDKNNAIPFVAEQNYVLSASYTLSTHWRLMLSNNYTGPRTLDNDPEQRSAKLPSYSLINSNLQYHQKRWQVNFRVNNLLNHDYNAYAFDVYNGQQTTSYFYPATGINFMLNTSVQL